MILIHRSHTQGPHPRILAIGFPLLYEGCRKEIGGSPTFPQFLDGLPLGCVSTDLSKSVQGCSEPHL